MTVSANQRSLSALDEPWSLSNWYKKINWLHTPLLTALPIIAAYGIYTTPLQAKTAIWAFLYYFYSGIGITAGYHRLWAHRSYTASLPFRIFIAMGGTAAVEGSIRWWSRDHRAHHRYTDTDKDPYSAHKGLLYSHIGWMVLKQDTRKIGRSDITDLNNDPLVKFQHKYYLPLALLMGFIFPTLVAGFGWGDFRGGYFYAAIVRLIVVHHATFCVNSLAHWLGETTFDDRHSPRDHFFTAIVTMGEGYHNFHHEFPQDYRNAIKFYQYDPTKWLIRFCSFFGLTSNLKKFPENEIIKGQVHMKEKQLEVIKSKLNWGVPLNELPVLEFEEFQSLCKNDGQSLILIEGVVYDVSKFIDEHPGGRSMILTGIGKDMTAAFNGGVYDHANAARNLMSTMRVAVIAGGMEVESRKTK